MYWYEKLDKSRSSLITNIDIPESYVCLSERIKQLYSEFFKNKQECELVRKQEELNRLDLERWEIRNNIKRATDSLESVKHFVEVFKNNLQEALDAILTAKNRMT